MRRYEKNSFFHFYRKKRVVPGCNGVQARIRRAHASRARGFSSQPPRHTPVRPFLVQSRNPYTRHLASLALSSLSFLPYGRLQLDRPTLDPLTFYIQPDHPSSLFLVHPPFDSRMHLVYETENARVSIRLLCVSQPSLKSRRERNDAL